MKIRCSNREGNKVAVEAEVDYSAFLAARENALREAGKDIRIPGFRPGKAPRNMLEKAVDASYLDSRAAQDMIADLYPQIVSETKINPVDYPNVEILQQEENKPFVFKISVDVYPEVKLGKYKGLKVEKKKAEVTEEEILKVLGTLQERVSKTGPDGKKELLPLDDDFAGKVSSFGTLAELKEEVRKTMLADRTAEAEADFKNNLIAAASAEAKGDIPSAMIEREIGIMLDELRASLSQSNLTLEDYLKGTKKEEKGVREEFRKSAEIRVRGKVVLAAVAEAEKLKVTEDEVEKELKKIAETSAQDPAELKKNISEGFRGYINEYLLRQKALDFIIEKAKEA